MKLERTTTSLKNRHILKIVLIISIVFILLQLISYSAFAEQHYNGLFRNLKDTVANKLMRQLNNPEVLKKLNFEKSVKRFYKLNNYKPCWVKPDTAIKATTSAMLMLDCVRQWGLQKENYHPKILNYDLMYSVLSAKHEATIEQKAMFDLMLTDAMISIINHLHYGSFNPIYTHQKLDNGINKELNAVSFLNIALREKDLMAKILTVQPKFKPYIQLQEYMRLITGQYTCDSYEIPETEVQGISINMERLRWISTNDKAYIHINIPSFQLTYQLPDSTLLFKVIVGKPANPSPTLQSKISYLETAPDWKIPSKIFINEFLPKAVKNNSFFKNNHISVYDIKGNYITINAKTLAQIKHNPKQYMAKQTKGCDNALGKVVFRFKNSEGIYLHDTPEQHLFDRKERAFSHGCIRVNQATNLAELLLIGDHQANKIKMLQSAIENYKKQNFILNKPLPILITYLTYTIDDGMLAVHDDIYKLDKGLQLKMFGNGSRLTKN